MQTEIYRRSIAHLPQFEPAQYRHFEIEPFTGALGAEISGLDISAARGTSGVAEDLRDALHKHLLLVFRDQNLSVDELRAFGQLFGPLQVNPVVKKSDSAADVMVVRQEAHEHYNFAGNWHTDVSWNSRPSGETALYAVEVPTCGGDTHFANTVLAYEALSDELKSLLRGLRAVHSLERSQSEFAAKKFADANLSGEQARARFAEHPVVRVHPGSGLRSLFVCEQFTTRFVGMSEEESRPLLESLWRHQVRPDFTCRVRWAKGSLAIWDNRCTVHYASNDYPNQRRIMMRVSTVGEVPLAAS